MSRFTTSPPHKPSSFQFPRGAPPSPPETHSEAMTLAAPQVLSTGNSIGGQDYFPHDVPLASASPDTAGSRFRKTSSIPYHSSGLRETRERPPQRSTKSLIIVIPPSTLTQEHGQQGHSLSNGPYHRLVQGVVMPLFPSMYGQLTAIAREFNFPSTTGLCLYFHYVENGITVTPRISDESWQSLWSHLSEPLPPNERRPLIGGKVEFDIDIRLARWYASWVVALHRETADIPSHPHSSAAPSIAHFRGESRTTTADTRFFDDDSGDNSVIHQHSAPIGRHVPRKLSLVERFDMSARQEPRASVQSAGAPQDVVVSASKVLSTIVQEDEPKTATILSWRASALMTHTKLAATGQTSLDPSNLPNNMPIDTISSEAEEEGKELNLDDFHWSVSSIGPLSPGEISPVSWRAAPSVDLAHRMEGSVASTLSYRTSSGPSDYDPLSPVLWGYYSPAPSVDLARRMEGSVCSTASYRTSFGPSDYDPYSPVAYSERLLSPDIAHRFFESTPPTPLTSTTWGAPLSYPPSPRCSSPTPSVDIGERSMHDALEASFRYYLTVAPAQPWAHGWPYHNRHSVDSPSESGLQVQEKPEHQPWQQVWPYRAHSAVQTEPSAGPWEHVWPYHKFSTAQMKSSEHSQPWSHVWPYRTASTRSGPEVLTAKPWSYVWPYTKDHSQIVGETVTRDGKAAENELPLHPPFSYPYLTIYSPVYPYLDLYPSIPGTLGETSAKTATMDSSLSTKFPASYPIFDLYPPVYPYNLSSIYPHFASSLESCASPEGYPFFNIYPTTSGLVNAYLSLYLSTPRSQYPYFEIYPGVAEGTSKSEALPTTGNAENSRHHYQGYPNFNLYPAVYPYFDLYPAVKAASDEKQDTLENPQWRLPNCSYPAFNLYPAVYPFFDLYPAIGIASNYDHAEATHTTLSWATSQSGYPAFNLYPAVYPHFDLYPAPYFNSIKLHTVSVVKTEERHALCVNIAPAYPSFNLYPSLYPYLNIYPAPYFSDSLHGEMRRSSPFSPLGYPHFDLYPELKTSKAASNRKVAPNYEVAVERRRKTKSARLTHSELHAMVIMENVTSVPSGSQQAGMQNLMRNDSITGSMPLPGLPSPSGRAVLRRPSIGSFRRASIVQSADRTPSPELTRKSSTGGSFRNVDRGVGLALSRNSSTSSRQSIEPGAGGSLGRRPSMQREMRQTPSRRDSLVMQRVKAFDANADASTTLPSFPKDSSSKFTPLISPNNFSRLPPIPMDRGL